MVADKNKEVKEGPRGDDCGKLWDEIVESWEGRVDEIICEEERSGNTKKTAPNTLKEKGERGERLYNLLEPAMHVFIFGD